MFVVAFCFEHAFELCIYIYILTHVFCFIFYHNLNGFIIRFILKRLELIFD